MSSPESSAHHVHFNTPQSNTLQQLDTSPTQLNASQTQMDTQQSNTPRAQLTTSQAQLNVQTDTLEQQRRRQRSAPTINNHDIDLDLESASDVSSIGDSSPQ